MKLFQKAVAAALCVVLLLSCAIPAGAVMAMPLKVGDVDRDDDITALDATLIQRFIAEISKPTELQLALSDADGDGDVSVLDATVILRHVAGMPSRLTNAVITDYVCGFISFHSDSEIAIADHYTTQESCYVGVPVTFYPKAYGSPRQYTLIVDGETVYQIAAEEYNTGDGISYTFDEEGEHVVTCDAECCYGQHTQSRHTLRAEPLPEDGSPVVMGAVFYDADYRSSGNGVLTVKAAGGTAPYQYNYTLYYDGLSPLCAPADNQSEIMPAIAPDEYTTGYIDQNEINVLDLFAKHVSKSAQGYSDVMRVKITVRDAQGHESRPVTASYIGYEICY